MQCPMPGCTKNLRPTCDSLLPTALPLVLALLEQYAAFMRSRLKSMVPMSMHMLSLSHRNSHPVHLCLELSGVYTDSSLISQYGFLPADASL